MALEGIKISQNGWLCQEFTVYQTDIKQNKRVSMYFP